MVTSSIVSGDFRVGVLGPLTVSADGGSADLGGPKQRLLLALLLADVDRVVSNDRLIAGLWGDEPPPTARKAVQVHVSNLRRTLGDGFPLRTAPGGYVVQSAHIDLDAAAFEAELDAAKAKLRTDPLAAERMMSDALARWKGPAYADVDDEPALESEIARLNELRLQALEGRIDAGLRAGRHTDVVGELATLSAEHPYRERFTELHMLALYRSGRQTEALRAYQRTRSTLVDELGVEPGPALQTLHRQILEQSVDLDLDEADGGDRFAFLATDIEASTAMWEADPDAMQQAVARHDEVLATAVEANAGTVFKGTGDGIFAVFADAADALQAAVDGQQALHDEPWPTGKPLLVRMGVDEGPASARGGDYFGPALNRVSRIMSSGHGGQVLCPAELAVQAPVATRDLGGADYKGVGRLDVAQLVIPGVPDEFPDLQTDRAPKTTVRQGFGRAIRGYELRERLGEGAHGVVYRAYQAAIGREVAVKVIRPEHANRPEFVKRFEAEAQFVAQLEHPHIVSLYDYWRDPDGAYLVMQLLRGGSLSASLERAPWRPPAALKLLDQVGTALDYAHRQGVMHRDLKPANVLLDGEGNAYLTDFGIASQHLEAVGVPAGSSVAYVSPEELAGESAGLASDMYGLGLLTYEILTGDRPVLGGQPAAVVDRRPDLPPSLDQVLARATDPDPTKRFDRVDDFLRALRQAFGADVVTHERRAAPTEVRNPYKGLRAFAETDAHDFFGRDELVRELLDHVTTHPLTAVVGPSGSGKSSLVRAGLLPQIRRRMATGQGTVLVTDMYPGSYPFEELEAALLRVAVDRPDGLLADLIADDRGLLRMSKQILPDDDSELLLVIDQFEELFLLTHDDEARRRFLASLVTVAGDERSRVRVVVTMRADHFDRPLSDPDFGALLRENVVPISMPTHDELTRAIAQPAAGAGLEFEAGLVPRIVHDVADEPGALPLMQYALTELVQAREGVELTTAAYARSGGVAGALARRAEEIHEGLSDAAQHAAREVFLRLVAVDDSGDDTRRRVRRAELESLGLGEPSLDAVLDAYGSFRLLSFDHDPITRGPTVEVAHEALIREWPRYRSWIDERREDLLLERRLAAASTEWDDGGRDPSFLFGGGQLEQYEQWAATTDVRLTANEREFLDESRRETDAARSSRRRRRQGIFTAVAVLAVLATVAAVLAFIERQDARSSAREAEQSAQDAERLARDESAARAEAETAREDADDARVLAETARDEATQALRTAQVRRMTAQAVSNRDEEPTLSLLLAVEAHERAESPDTLGALLTTLQRTDGYLGFIPSTSTSSNDQWTGALDDDTLVVRTPTTIDVYDLERRRLLASNPSAAPFDGPNFFAVGSVNDGRFATVDADGAVVTLTSDDPRPVVFGTAGGQPASMVAVGLDGSLTIGYPDGSVEVYSGDDLSSRTVVGRHPTVVSSGAVSPDHRFAAIEDLFGNLTLWDVERGEARWTWTYGAEDLHDPSVDPITVSNSIAGVPFAKGLIDGGPPAIEQPDPVVHTPSGLVYFSPDEKTLIVGDGGTTALDIETGRVRWSVLRDRDTTFQMHVLGDGTVVRGRQVIDVEGNARLLPGLGPVSRTTVTPDGSILIAGAGEGLSLWSMSGDQLIAKGFPRRNDDYATVSGDGTQLASFDYASDDFIRPVNWTDVESGSALETDHGWLAHTGNDHLIAYGRDRTIRVLDPETNEPVGNSPTAQPWGTYERSPDGTLLAVGDIFEPKVRIYDIASGELVTELGEPLPADSRFGVFFLDFSPDGSMLAASAIAGAAVWSTASWQSVHAIEPRQGEGLTELAFSPDGNRIGVGSDAGATLEFDVGRGELEVLASGTAIPAGIYDVNGLEYTEDGRYVVVAGEDGANMIDVESGSVIGTRIPSTSLGFGASIGHGATALVTGTEDHLLVWNLDPTTWPDIACRAAGRNMTEDEWEQFGWPGEPYNATCSQWEPDG